MRAETKPERFGTLARLPLFFALKGRRAVIAGGSPAAAWKAELLSATGARVDVYAVDACSQLSKLATDSCDGEVVLHRRTWTAADLSGAALAIGDFCDDKEAAAFAAAARAAGIPVNAIDKPACSDFSFGSIVNRSPLVIGISTDGAAPVFAQAIRGKLEALLPGGFGHWAAAAARWRAAVQAAGLSVAGRRKFWELFTTHAVANADDDPGQADFDRFIAGARGTGNGIEHGSVTVLDVERNDPDLLTLRAVRALQAADVILFDGQISHKIIDFARREASKIRIGKTKRDGEIDAMMIELKNQGARVVRLKCRDHLKDAQIPEPTPAPAAPPLVPRDCIMAAN